MPLQVSTSSEIEYLRTGTGVRGAQSRVSPKPRVRAIGALHPSSGLLLHRQTVRGSKIVVKRRDSKQLASPLAVAGRRWRS